jgi:uncharacterized RDD family membrane protein YckC
MAEPLAASRMPSRLVAQTKPDQGDALEGVLGSRVVAYLIDSVIIGIVAIAFIGIGFGILLLKTHGGTSDVPDSALWGFVYASLAAVPATAILNFVLLLRRGQTVGQYIIGLRVVREDRGNAGFPQLMLYMVGLHPLVFHPLLAAFWALLAYVALSLTSSDVLVLGSLGIAILCVAGPLVALISGGPDGGRRGLHDRLAGLMVVRVE